LRDKNTNLVAGIKTQARTGGQVLSLCVLWSFNVEYVTVDHP